MISLEQIKQKLLQSFPNSKVEVIDTSAGHENHASSGAHMAVLVTWEGFRNKSLVEQHQMVYDALKEELKEQIHALNVKTKVE